jgi:hypothetical protein
VAQLPDEQRQIAREAYFESLRTMYIMYVAFAGLGLLVSFLVGSNKLSKDHTEHKTGLDQMRRSNQDRSGDILKAGDEEKGQSAKAPESSPEEKKGEEKKGLWHRKAARSGAEGESVSR